MAEHADFGGSTIERTVNCPGWFSFCKKLPPQKSSKDADQGTLCHNAMERIYSSDDEDFDERSVIGMTYKGLTLSEELYEEKIVPAMAAMERLFDRYEVLDGDHRCEARVILADDIWGTADILAVGEFPLELESGEFSLQPLKVGICSDYKFGYNLVDAEQNEQGLFYSLAGSMTPKTKRFFEEIDILAVGIVQPNEQDRDDLSVWEVDPAILIQKKTEFLDAVATAKGPNPPFSKGKWCRFCTGKGLCPATTGALAALKRIDVTAPELIENIPTFNELEQLSAIIKALRKFVHEQLEEGVKIEGYKIVPKRATRVYTDEVEVLRILKASKKIKGPEFLIQTLVTPPQLEKVCKKKNEKKLNFETLFGSLVKKVSSGTTLASSDDKREAVPGIESLKTLADISG